MPIAQDVNPDIQPGDHIVVTDSEGRDEVVVDNIRFTGRPFQQGGGGALADVLVPFSAFDPAGAPIPLAAINAADFRLGPRLRYRTEELHIEANEQGGAGAYFLRYSAPFTPSRNRDLLTQEEVVLALLGPGHTVGYSNIDVAIPTAAGTKAMLAEGVIDSTGPAAGCPFFPPPQPCAAADLAFDAAALQAQGTCPNPAVAGSLFASGFTCQPGCVAGASCVECGGLQCLDGVWSGISAAVCARDCALPALPLGTATGSCTSATLSGHAGACLLEALPFFVLRAGSLQLTCNDGVVSELPQLEKDTAAAAAAAAAEAEAAAAAAAALEAAAAAAAAAEAEAAAAAAAQAEADAAAAAALAAEAEAAAAAQAEASAAAAAAAAAQAEAEAAAAAAEIVAAAAAAGSV